MSNLTQATNQAVTTQVLNPILRYILEAHTQLLEAHTQHQVKVLPVLPAVTLMMKIPHRPTTRKTRVDRLNRPRMNLQLQTDPGSKMKFYLHRIFLFIF